MSVSVICKIVEFSSLTHDQDLEIPPPPEAGTLPNLETTLVTSAWVMNESAFASSMEGMSAGLKRSMSTASLSLLAAD